jgi:hypothetical protein
MRILLSCSNTNSPSFIFYKDSLKKLKNESKNIKFTAKKYETKVLEEDFDIVLFMSGTKNSNFVKKKNVLYGLIDPRAGNYDNFDKYDFIIANGIEEKFFFSFAKLPTLIYPVYPSIKLKKKKFNKNKTIISYHGNREHLINMYPSIFNAIKKIASKHLIELLLIYDFKNKGKVSFFNQKEHRFKIYHKQYHDKCFEKYLYDTDIGIVPQLIPFQTKKIKKNFSYYFSKQLFKKNYFFSLNFKETTNLGRHFVFAQLKIPTISDYTLSSSNFINNRINGFLAHDTVDWYECFEYLINNKKKSQKIGSKFYLDWKKKYSHSILNKKFLKFLKNLNDK